jgi:putative ABC transport system permease protein
VESIAVLQVAASLALVVVAGLLGWFFRLGISRRLAVAAIRAAVQLVALGYVLEFILGSSTAEGLAWAWVLVMVGITGFVGWRRTPDIRGAGMIAGMAVAATVASCLLVVFGLGVLDYEPVNVVVMAGIVAGNALPSQVLGSKLLTETFRDRRGEVEALVALGFDRLAMLRVLGGPMVSKALIPQIERTNVVGLISLPGAMTGLLLAGAEPLDAVLVQLIVMYLVLGAVAITTSVTVVVGMLQLFHPDRRPRTLGGAPVA